MADRPLEQIIIERAKNGRLNYFSFYATWDGNWIASYRGTSDKDMRTFEHADPVQALRGALTGRAGKPVKEPVQKRTVEQDSDDDIFAGL